MTERVKAVISFEPSGSQASQLASEARDALSGEFGAQYQIDFSPSKGFGIAESLVVTIAGAVVSHFIIRLIDLLCGKRRTVADNIDVRVYRIDTNVEFVLPRDSTDMIQHFKQAEINLSQQQKLEDKDEPTREQ